MKTSPMNIPESALSAVCDRSTQSSSSPRDDGVPLPPQAKSNTAEPRALELRPFSAKTEGLSTSLQPPSSSKGVSPLRRCRSREFIGRLQGEERRHWRRTRGARSVCGDTRAAQTPVSRCAEEALLWKALLSRLSPLRCSAAPCALSALLRLEVVVKLLTQAQALLTAGREANLSNKAGSRPAQQRRSALLSTGMKKATKPTTMRAGSLVPKADEDAEARQLTLGQKKEEIEREMWKLVHFHADSLPAQPSGAQLYGQRDADAQQTSATQTHLHFRSFSPIPLVFECQTGLTTERKQFAF